MIMSYGKKTLEYESIGSGPPIILIHSTASSLKQWKFLIEALKDQYTLLAVNLFGYGQSSKWAAKDGPQSLLDQVNLFKPLLDRFTEPISFIGHSFGGSVAMRAALKYHDQLKTLILLEPNPFFLFSQLKQPIAYSESKKFGDLLELHKEKEDWEGFSKIFLSFWIGDHAWQAMSIKQQKAFLGVIPNIYHEAEAIFSEQMKIEDFLNIQKKILLISTKDTNLVSKEIARLLATELPELTEVQLPKGGHMAPVNSPEVVNPIICDHLSQIA